MATSSPLFRSFRWQRPAPGIRRGDLPLFPPAAFPPFRFGRRGWRLRLPGSVAQSHPSPPLSLLPTLPFPLRSALLGLVRLRLERLRSGLPLVPRPPPLVLPPPPFRLRRRRGIRPLFPLPLLRQRLLPLRRRRGIRRWLLRSLAALVRRVQLSPFAVFARLRRTPRRLRPLITPVVVYGIRPRLPLAPPPLVLRPMRWPPRPRLGGRRPVPGRCPVFFPRYRRFRRFPRFRRRAPIG